MGQKRSGERGIALILALLVLSILIILVTQFAWSTSVERTIARNSKDELKMLFAARGTLAFARAYLRQDRVKGGKADSLREDWAGDTPEQSQRAITIGDVNCQVRIEDSERFLNVNLFYNKATRPYAMEVVKRLCERLQSQTTENGINTYTSTSSSTGTNSSGSSGDAASELAARIADYLDEDTEGEFEQGARNLPVTHADELLAMPNLTPELYEMLAGVEGDPYRNIEPRQGILDFLTASGSQKINVNTAPEQLLWAMIPDTNAQGQSIAEQRDDAVSKILSARTGTEVDAAGNETGGSTGTSTSTGSSTSSDGSEKPGKDFNTTQEWAQASGIQGLISATNATATADANGTVTVKGIPTSVLSVTSQDFRVTVDASRAGLSKSYEAIVRRGDTQFDVLIFREKQTPPSQQSQNQLQGQW